MVGKGVVIIVKIIIKRKPIIFYVFLVIFKMTYAIFSFMLIIHSIALLLDLRLSQMEVKSGENGVGVVLAQGLV